MFPDCFALTKKEKNIIKKVSSKVCMCLNICFIQCLAVYSKQGPSLLRLSHKAEKTFRICEDNMTLARGPLVYDA